MRAIALERYANAVEPDEVAELVHRAILVNRLFILTHAETLDWMQERQQRIADDMAALGALR